MSIIYESLSDDDIFIEKNFALQETYMFCKG